MSESVSCPRRNFINAPPDASQLHVHPSPGFIGSAVPQPRLLMGGFEPPMCRRVFWDGASSTGILFTLYKHFCSIQALLP